MRRFLLLFVLLTGSAFPAAAQPAAPFTRGVNLTNWFQATPGTLPFGRYDSTDFADIRSLGADAIRLPVDLKAMLRADLSLDPRFLFFFEEAVRWAAQNGLVLILDNHTFDVTVDTKPEDENWLTPAWMALTRRYKDRFPHVLFELQNEPHGISDAAWNAIQLRLTAAIRAEDSARWLIIGGAGWNGFTNLEQMPAYPFERLIYTFHYYDPFLFTHQGASWVSPSLVPLAGVPFPYRSGALPPVPPALAGTWVADGLASYATYGRTEALIPHFDQVKRFAVQRNAPVFCGEFGVLMTNAPASDRTAWYRFVREQLERRAIPWTSWDYHGGFGLYRPGSAGRFRSDLDSALVRALGFTAPPQEPWSPGPEQQPLLFFEHWVRKGFSVYGARNTPFTESTAGNPLLFTGAPQYHALGIGFDVARDLSVLKARGAFVEITLAGTAGTGRLDLRFMDTNGPGADRPWRMVTRLDEENARWGGGYRTLRIPLSAFAETGAWDENQWFPAEGRFDWTAVDRLELVAEHHPVLLDSVFIRSLRLGLPEETRSGTPVPEAFELAVSPNPFNPSASVVFSGTVAGPVMLEVLDLTGRRVALLFEGAAGSGPKTVRWDASRKASGVYLIRLSGAGFQTTRKVTLLK